MGDGVRSRGRGAVHVTLQVLREPAPSLQAVTVCVRLQGPGGTEQPTAHRCMFCGGTSGCDVRRLVFRERGSCVLWAGPTRRASCSPSTGL